MTHKASVMTFSVVLALAALAQAQTFTTLYAFTGGLDGQAPVAGVIQDPAGNLYGTAAYAGDLNCGGGFGCGVVYKLNPAGTEAVLYSFSANNNDSQAPEAPVVRDAAGNLYGTASYGGSTGNGTVFKIDTVGNETVLYNFTGGSDGCTPIQGLAMDKVGNLYGTTFTCGSSGHGTVFEVSSKGKFILLHTFLGGSSDGALPYYGRLTRGADGNLYGVTTEGGSTSCYGLGCGVVYKLSKKGTMTVLHSFTQGTSDGCIPYGSAVRDGAGNLYGTTAGCGSSNGGIIWKVSKTGTETILYTFAGGTSDGCGPEAGVTRDSKGNLYGVTIGCGANGSGTLYSLSKKGKLTTLYSFCAQGGSNCTDGTSPIGEVLRTANGTLFGTTSSYGPYYSGTVWSYVP